PASRMPSTMPSPAPAKPCVICAGSRWCRRAARSRTARCTSIRSCSRSASPWKRPTDLFFHTLHPARTRLQLRHQGRRFMRLSRRTFLLAPALLAPLPAWAARPAPSAPLWEGARYTHADKKRAIRRGLDFIYRTAKDEKNYAEYGSDYLW